MNFFNGFFFYMAKTSDNTFRKKKIFCNADDVGHRTVVANEDTHYQHTYVHSHIIIIIITSRRKWTRLDDCWLNRVASHRVTLRRVSLSNASLIEYKSYAAVCWYSLVVDVAASTLTQFHRNLFFPIRVAFWGYVFVLFVSKSFSFYYYYCYFLFIN